jgi:serine phosphatase RsbU (regulator of sigma subunit)
VSPPPPSTAGDETARFVALHACRSPDELDGRMADELARRLPSTSFALCLADDAGGSLRVQMARGVDCPLRVRSRCREEDWPVAASQRIPIRYGSHLLGSLVVAAPLDAEAARSLPALLAHYGCALVNLTLNEESRQATDNYCASLQALEEGIVLFQEEDPQAVMARLLSLATTVVQATAGALYVLREVGDSGSGLALEQALGIPDTLLATFRSTDGSDWPECLMGEGVRLLERSDDGSMGMLPAECLPPILQNLVVLPMRYHGVEAGLCVLFNATKDTGGTSDRLGRVQSLGQLGAALLHRLRLEALTVCNRSIARELQIAQVIQQRLLPTRSPSTSEYEFAWSSLTAQSIGGDYLDFLTSDLGDVYAVIADASGHGINSAILMTSFRSTYRADAPWMEPESLLGSMNSEVVHEVGATGMFITAVTLRIEREGRRLRLTSAGHNPIFLFRHRTGSIESIDSHGPPLGFVGGVKYEAFETVLETGDVLLLYTDGITEAANADLEMFGEERLVALLRQHCGASAETLLAESRRALVEFTGRETYDDDVSMTVIRAL